jgi:hypothetical protein
VKIISDAVRTLGYSVYTRTNNETVKLVDGKNINNGKKHTWLEWTDSEGQEWAINFNTVKSVQ